MLPRTPEAKYLKGGSSHVPPLSAAGRALVVVSNAGEPRSITSSNSNEEVLVIVMVEAGDGEADVDFDDACS